MVQLVEVSAFAEDCGVQHLHPGWDGQIVGNRVSSDVAMHGCRHLAGVRSVEVAVLFGEDVLQAEAVHGAAQRVEASTAAVEFGESVFPWSRSGGGRHSLGKMSISVSRFRWRRSSVSRAWLSTTLYRPSPCGGSVRSTGPSLWVSSSWSRWSGRVTVPEVESGVGPVRSSRASGVMLKGPPAA